MFRPSRLLVAVSIVPLVLAAACGDKTSDGIIVAGTGTATVRFVNATSLSISVSNNGLVVSPTTGIGFGLSTTCLTVPTGSLVLTNAATGNTLQFNSTLTAGGSFTVVAYTDASGNVKFAVIDNNFTPNSGSAGIAVFNAASGQAVLAFASNGATLGSGVAFGTSSVFVNVSGGSDDITFLVGGSLILDAGSINLSPGSNTIIVVGPPAAGSTTLRAIRVTGC